MPSVQDLLVNPKYKRTGPNTWYGTDSSGKPGTFVVEQDGLPVFVPENKQIYDMLLTNKPMPATPHKAPAPYGKMPSGGLTKESIQAISGGDPEDLNARIKRGGDELLNEYDRRKQRQVGGGTNSPKTAATPAVETPPVDTQPETTASEPTEPSSIGNAGIEDTSEPWGLTKKEQDLLNANKPLLMMAAAPRPDVGPLLSLIDTWTGSKLGEGYKSPGTLGDQAVRLGKGYSDILSAITDRDYKKGTLRLKEDEQINNLIQLWEMAKLGLVKKEFVLLQAKKLEAEKLKAETGKIGAETGKIQAQTATLDALRGSLVDLNTAKAGLTDAQSTKARADAARAIADIDRIKADIDNKRVTAERGAAMIKEIEARTKKLLEEARRTGIHADHEGKTGTKMPTPRASSEGGIKLPTNRINSMAGEFIGTYSEALGRYDKTPSGDVKDMLKGRLSNRFHNLKSSYKDKSDEEILTLLGRELEALGIVVDETTSPVDKAKHDAAARIWGLK